MSISPREPSSCSRARIAEAARTLGARAGPCSGGSAAGGTAGDAVGVALVLLETLNDIGASEYLGVRTLTVSVYTTWLERGSLAGAAQIVLPHAGDRRGPDRDRTYGRRNDSSEFSAESRG